MGGIFDMFKYKTYIAAVGLVGLAIYQVSIGEFQGAIQSVLGALAAVGLRQAIAKVPKELSANVIDASASPSKFDK